MAREATAAASFTEQPPMRLGALNDGPGHHGVAAARPVGQLPRHDEHEPSRLGQLQVGRSGADRTRPASSSTRTRNWIRPPASWKIEYLDGSGDWKPVQGATYPTTVNTWLTVNFTPVTTTALRATFKGGPRAPTTTPSRSPSGRSTPSPDGYRARPAVVTKPGVAPALPQAVRATVGGQSLWAPVNWRPVAASEYADEGTFKVEGRALGVASGYVTATVTVDEDATTTAADRHRGASGRAIGALRDPGR